MNYITKLCIATVLLFILDIPWLLYNKSWFIPMMSRIQGSPAEMKLWPAIVVYPVMAYVLLEADSIQKAFAYGAASYAIYDFTNLATIKGYDPLFAVADTLWGGVLFSAAKWIMTF
jgi:uncharacterized membrane protein